MMTIYEELGQWVLWVRWNDIHLYFEKRQEAFEAMAKIDLAKAIIWRAQQLTETMDNGPDVVQEYFDSGITFTDYDLESLGVTASQVVSCITLLQNITKFFGGDDTLTPAVYRTTVNSIRRINV